MIYRKVFKPLDLLISASIMSLLLIPMSVFATPNKYDLYLEIKSHYDKSEYAKCIEECGKIINEQENSFIQAKEYTLLAGLYEIKADCYDRKGEKEKARGSIQSLLTKLESLLQRDESARLKLKIGHIYKNEGRYSKALSAYEDVEKEYKEIPQNRFAKYAKEYIDEIKSHQVAVISGKISFEDTDDVSGAVIEVFNGFERCETNFFKGGEYSLPLYSSTPGTKISLFAYRWGYVPAIITTSFAGSSNIEMKDIRLKPLPNEDVGVVAGVVFNSISGGRRTPHHGIAGFFSHKIEILKLSGALNGQETTKGGEISTISSDDGIYTFFLVPGSYFINKRAVTIARGEVKIENINQGQIMVD